MFDNCTIEVGEVVVGVNHGDFIVDPSSCRRCRCDDGSLEECESPLTCQRIQSNPTSCTYNGETISHGKKIIVRILASSDYVHIMGMCDSAEPTNGNKEEFATRPLEPSDKCVVILLAIPFNMNRYTVNP